MSLTSEKLEGALLLYSSLLKNERCVEQEAEFDKAALSDFLLRRAEGRAAVVGMMTTAGESLLFYKISLPPFRTLPPTVPSFEKARAPRRQALGLAVMVK